MKLVWRDHYSIYSCCDVEGKLDCLVYRKKFFCAWWHLLIIWQNHSNTLVWTTSIYWVITKMISVMTWWEAHIKNADGILLAGYLHSFTFNKNTNKSLFPFSSMWVCFSYTKKIMKGITEKKYYIPWKWMK